MTAARENSDDVEYAIQVRWPDGDWLFVTQQGANGDRIPILYHSYADAEASTSIWAEGSTRIVSRTVSDWTEAKQ